MVSYWLLFSSSLLFVDDDDDVDFVSFDLATGGGGGDATIMQCVRKICWLCECLLLVPATFSFVFKVCLPNGGGEERNRLLLGVDGGDGSTFSFVSSNGASGVLRFEVAKQVALSAFIQER